MSQAIRFARRRAPLGLLAAAIAAGSLATPPAFAQQTNPPRQTRPAQPPAANPAPQAPAPGAPAPGAAAGAQQGPTVVAVKPEPSQTEWTKVCGKDQASGAEICYTTRDFVSDQGQPVLAVAVYDIKAAQAKENSRIVRFLMPLGLLLQPGVRFGVDQGQATPGRYAVCFPNGCFAESPVSNDIVNQVKRGNTLNVSVQNQAAREVTFAIPLAGFGKAFDGPPVDPKALEEQQKKLQDELQKRSDELRKRLEQSSGSATPAPAANGATPATAPKP